MRVVVLGATGMLGHKLVQVLGREHEVTAALRGSAQSWPRAIPVAALWPGLDVADAGALSLLLDEMRPDVVLNAVGVVKQVIGVEDRTGTVAVNALFPNVLAGLCATRGIRLVHYSTDCVFSGAADSRRGPNGYREEDPADARDLYGLSKLLGEPTAATTLVLRTSMIGRELRGRHSLVEWFLAQGAGPVKGYTRALFTGLTTLELARVTALLLRAHPDMAGLWHVAAAPIDKLALLTLVKHKFARDTALHSYDEFFCDRRLDGARFAQATGWYAPPWPEMIEAMQQDSLARPGVAA